MTRPKGIKSNYNPIKCNGCLSTYKPTSSNQVLCPECGGGDASAWTIIFRKYGWTKPMWEAVYFEQDGQCVLCDKEATAVDHCHKTGKPRALLCTKCNVALHYIENLEWKRKAEEYVAV